MERILITSRIADKGLEELFKLYRMTHSEVEVMQRDEVLKCIPQYECIVPVNVRADRELIDTAANLKLISCYGAGYDNVDVGYATSKGIMVTNIPDSVTEATAELGFGLMLSLVRRISECDRKLRSDSNFEWGVMKNLGNTLYGKTLGIIGMGRIGRAVARRAKAFGMSIIYYNRSRLSPELEDGAVYKTFDGVLENSDVVYISTPLSEGTRHMIGEKEFGKMKSSAFIVNTSRGAVIDEQAMVKALETGRIAGAGLDVFEKEPVITPALFNMDQVVMAPHIGSATIETRIFMSQEMSKNIIDFFSGRIPKYVVNPDVIK